MYAGLCSFILLSDDHFVTGTKLECRFTEAAKRNKSVFLYYNIREKVVRMDVLCTSEHTSCSLCASEKTALFRRYMIETGGVVCLQGRSEGLLLYVLDGAVNIFMDGAFLISLESGAMTYVAHDGKYLLKAVSATGVMTCSVSLHQPLCPRYTFSALLKDFERTSAVSPNLPPPPP